MCSVAAWCSLEECMCVQKRPVFVDEFSEHQRYGLLHRDITDLNLQRSGL